MYLHMYYHLSNSRGGGNKREEQYVLKEGVKSSKLNKRGEGINIDWVQKL